MLLGRAPKPKKTKYLICATRRKRFICECARSIASYLPLALRSGALRSGALRSGARALAEKHQHT